MLQLQYLQIFHVWGCISLCSFTFRGVWSVREAGTVSRGNWIKSVKILRSFLVDSCVQGASVPLSPPCIFHHTLPFFLYYLAFPSPLNFHVVCADIAFLSLAHKALWCSVCWSWSTSVFVCMLCACAHIHAKQRTWLGMLCSLSLPRLSHSHTLKSHYMWSPSPTGKRKIEGERELLRKVYLVSWQHPNYKIVETPCIERIFLNYSEQKFKFHFVLALSNGQNCLGEISKGQGELKCLL